MHKNYQDSGFVAHILFVIAALVALTFIFGINVIEYLEHPAVQASIDFIKSTTESVIVFVKILVGEMSS